MTPGPPPLADAADPLGKLQRGLGAGYLWVLDADRAVAHALLMHCVFNDPRWDRRLDHRDEYHATLALDVNLHTSALERWLRDSDEDDADTTSDVLGMLGRMAVRGHADARRVLREYVAYGHFWPSDDALAQALAGLDPRERPWTLWSVDNRRIARAFGTRGARRRERPPGRRRPREMSTAELLQVAEDSRWTQIADELANRTAPADVEQLLAAANDPAVPMCRAAILALGRQGRRELLEIAEQATSHGRRGRLQGAVALALEAMPLSQTRALAHDWLMSADWARRRKAAGMLAAWAEDEDLEPARRALSDEFDLGLDGDVYVIGSLSEALGRCGLHGPFDELLRAYEATPYSYGPPLHRRRSRGVGPHLRWRRRGRVPVGLRGADARARRGARRPPRPAGAQRLEELASDQVQAASVRTAAAQRPGARQRRPGARQPRPGT